MSTLEDHRQLVALLGRVAPDQPHLRPLLQRARLAIVELIEMSGAGDEQRCPRCGETVVQPGRGRPRVWCSDRCRRAAYRDEKATKC